jgi:hypothetical protein
MDDRILSRQGLSIRQIAVLRGGSRNAVRRALRSAAPPTGKRCRAKSVALERYIPQITAWLRDEVTMLWTAERASSRDSKSTAMMVAAPFHRLSRGRAFRRDRLQRHAPVHRFRDRRRRQIASRTYAVAVRPDLGGAHRLRSYARLRSEVDGELSRNAFGHNRARAHTPIVVKGCDEPCGWRVGAYTSSPRTVESGAPRCI